MQKSISRKIIALSLALIMIFSSAILLIGCDVSDKGNGGSDSGGGTPSGGQSSGSGNGGSDSGGGTGAFPSKPEIEDYHDKIKVPEYKDYGRTTVKFENVVYSRPDFDAAINGFNRVIAIIEANELSFEEQVAAIEGLEPIYSNVLTMNSLASLNNSKNTSDAYWNGEFAYNSEKYPSFAKKVEDMFVAAANSPLAERFEDEYFGEGLIEQYKDGGRYSDRAVELFEKEAELEASFSSLSTATVEITVNEKTDTVDNLLDYFREEFGSTSKEYNTAYTVCMQEYEYKVDDISKSLLVELIRTRKLIATELGDDSFITYAYEALGRDYTPEQMSKFLDDVAEFVVPVFTELYSFVFYPYFYPYDEAKRHEPTKQTLDALVNNGYSYLCEVDSELADIYRYMLQFDLYDIEKERTNRDEGAFTTYLYDYEAPYLFMTAYGDITDYSTLYHEFGHFADYYVNYDSPTSIDQSEVSSQGLEYIMLHFLEGKLSESDARYVMYNAMYTVLEVLLYQGFYARFEELAYSLPYEQITEANLNLAVATAAEEFALNSDVVNSISYVFIPHIFLYPFYVQSYCTSVIPAVELYFMEDEAVGTGLAAYKKLIDRNGSVQTFAEAIVEAGLSSPFADGVLRDIADKIHFAVLGFHYYKSESTAGGAAA